MLKLIELNNYGNDFQASILDTEDGVEDKGYVTVVYFKDLPVKGVLC